MSVLYKKDKDQRRGSWDVSMIEMMDLHVPQEDIVDWQMPDLIDNLSNEEDEDCDCDSDEQVVVGSLMSQLRAN